MVEVKLARLQVRSEEVWMCAIFGARQIKNFFCFHSYVDSVHLWKKKVRTGKKGPPSDLAVTLENIIWCLNPGISFRRGKKKTYIAMVHHQKMMIWGGISYVAFGIKFTSRQIVFFPRQMGFLVFCSRNFFPQKNSLGVLFPT